MKLWASSYRSISTGSDLQQQAWREMLRGSGRLSRSNSATHYSAKMPINQVASINTPEPRLITVQVWDKSNLAGVEKAIGKFDLGLNPVVDGLTLRLPIPELNQERRHRARENRQEIYPSMRAWPCAMCGRTEWIRSRSRRRTARSARTRAGTYRLKFKTLPTGP